MDLWPDLYITLERVKYLTSCEFFSIFVLFLLLYANGQRRKDRSSTYSIIVFAVRIEQATILFKYLYLVFYDWVFVVRIKQVTIPLGYLYSVFYGWMAEAYIDIYLPFVFYPY